MGFGSVKKHNRWMGWARTMAQTAGAIGLMLMLVSCGGESPGYGYTVGGSVSGLIGSGLVLRNNGGDDLSITANGTFFFAHAVSDGATYTVTVATQPGGLNQACAVVNGTGTIRGAVASVQVNCVQPPDRFAVDSSEELAGAVKYSDTKITPFTILAADGSLTAEATDTTGTNPNSITIEDVGALKIAYVANYNAAAVSGSVSVYTVDSTGATVQGLPVAAGKNPFRVTVAQIGSSQYAYVPNMGSNTISVYKIDSVTGALTVQGTPIATGANPYDIKIRKIAASNVYVAYVTNAGDNTISTYIIDSGTGALTAQGLPVTVGVNPGSVLVDSAGKYAYVANAGSGTISVFSIDQTTVTPGVLTPGSAILAGSNPVAMEIDPSGSFIYTPNVRSNSVSVFAINSSTGALIAGLAVGTGTSPCAIKTVNTGASSFAYVANYNSNNISVYKIESTGALTAVETKPLNIAATNPYQMTIRQTSSAYVLYVLNAGANNISTYTINTTTGVLMEVGSPVSY